MIQIKFKPIIFICLAIAVASLIGLLLIYWIFPVTFTDPAIDKNNLQENLVKRKIVKLQEIQDYYNRPEVFENIIDYDELQKADHAESHFEEPGKSNPAEETAPPAQPGETNHDENDRGKTLNADLAESHFDKPGKSNPAEETAPPAQPGETNHDENDRGKTLNADLAESHFDKPGKSNPAEETAPPAQPGETNHDENDREKTLKNEKKPAAGQFFTVQIAALSDEHKAQEMINRLHEEGFPARIEQAEHGNGSLLFRIRVGDFSSRIDAEKTLRKIIETGRTGYVTKH